MVRKGVEKAKFKDGNIFPNQSKSLNYGVFKLL